jgi:transketolase
MEEKTSTRVAYGRALQEFGSDTNIIVLDADLSICTMTCMFKEKYPQRFFNVGIAESNMVGIAAGLATTGKKVFVNSFAMFAAGRAYEQIRNSLAYPNLDVKVIGTHAGLSVGEDGATHQCIEDLSLMRTIPGMTVICPSDANETYKAVEAMIKYKGPCYMRLGRLPVETVTSGSNYKFELGKGVTMLEGKDITIIATGLMLQEALKAAELLGKEGISTRVIDIHTIKPLDKEIIVKAARETGAIVTAEEHNIIGGLGSAVAEVLVEECPVPMLRIGVMDIFGRSGTAQALLNRYGLTANNIYSKAKMVLARKTE